MYFSPSAHVSAGGKGGYSVLLPACCASVMEENAAQGREASAAEHRRIAAEVNTAEEKPTEEIAAGKATHGKGTKTDEV